MQQQQQPTSADQPSRSTVYNVLARRSGDEEPAEIVGEAHLNPDGSIDIRLNPFVRLEGTLDLRIDLVPSERGAPAAEA